MQTTAPENELIGTTSSVSGDGNAFARLANLPPGTDKNTLIQTIDNAVDAVLHELATLQGEEIPADILLKVQTSLNFLEQCLIFKDDEFTTFAKRRANELQTSLVTTAKRLEEAETIPDAPSDQIPKETPIADTSTAKEEKAPEQPAVEEPPVDPNAFLYEREEKILIEYAYERLCKRLAFMRGDTVVAEKGKAVHVSGIHEDGVPPFFILAPSFPEILKQPFIDLIQEKRNLLGRRVYGHTDKEDSDEEIRRIYEEDRYRDIDGIIALGFDDWAGEIAKAGIAGLPQERKIVGPKKEEKDGIGSSLKKVFSFGGNKSKSKSKGKAKEIEIPDTNAIRIHKEWQREENKGTFSLSQHFSYSLISYAIQLAEKQFETEYECICQIVNQQDDPDVGPVITNLSRLYKFYDNIFFDLVILTLFQRKNKFDVNMLQAACMSQNFVVDRLPLCMDELRRRPMEHAKNLLAVLKDDEDKETVKQALSDYFHVHETIHASKVGKRIQASENLLKRQAEKLDERPKKVVDEALFILRDIANLKEQQEEEGTFLGEEILDTIAEGIERAIARW